MNDVEYYESYGYSHEEAKSMAAADRASTGLMFAVFRIFFICFKLFFLLLPAIFCSFLILEALKKPFSKTGRGEYFWWMFGIVYAIECVVFFLKGWQFSIRQRGNRFWLLVRSICLLYCFVLPECMFQVIIIDQVKRTPGSAISRLDLIAWVIGIVLGWLVYRRYRLSEDGAPFLFRWAFLIGRAC